MFTRYPSDENYPEWQIVGALLSGVEWVRRLLTKTEMTHREFNDLPANMLVAALHDGLTLHGNPIPGFEKVLETGLIADTENPQDRDKSEILDILEAACLFSDDDNPDSREPFFNLRTVVTIAKAWEFADDPYSDEAAFALFAHVKTVRLRSIERVQSYQHRLEKIRQGNPNYPVQPRQPMV